MTFITGKHLPRRTVLRGVGATIALPFLDAFLPAGGRSARSVRGMSLDPTRLVCIEMVHGAAGSTEYGASKHLWSPQGEGRDFDLSPGALSPLEPFRDYLTIISDTDVAPAEAVIPREIGGDHFRSSATFLTQAHPKQTESSDVQSGTSLDQMYAQRFGQDTPIPSMQLCIETVDQAGGCAYGYSCVYTDTISWASPTEPLPMIRNPRLAFDQLFGAGGTSEERAKRQRSRKSILDFLTDEVTQLKADLAPTDRRRMDRYLQDVREIERRIQRVEERNRGGVARELPGSPAGVPDSYDEHAKLMFDLQALALETDMTRVFSFKMSRDSSGRVYPESGVTKGFHSASHHGDRESSIEDFVRVNRYHVGLVAYFLKKLESIEEGDANLLDKTMVIYGSPMGNPNVHNHKRCPLFVAGHANGELDGNLHRRATPGTPMANAMLSLVHKLGLDDTKRLGDSTGPLSLSV